MLRFVRRLLRRVAAVGLLTAVACAVYAPFWLGASQPTPKPVIFHQPTSTADTHVLEVFTLPRSHPAGRHR